MNQPLPTYPDYKPAGLPWLAQVPAHWEEISIRAITQVRNERGRADLELLSVYREFGVIRKSSRDDNHNADGADLSAYKVVKPGYLVLNKMKTWQGSLGISQYEGIVSPAYIVCAVTRPDIDLKYLNQLLRSRPYVHAYNRISFGVRVGQWDMRYDDFKQIKVLLPPLAEQQQIVTFLEAKGRQVARLLRAKRQLIKLLQEQKQALIHRAVTQGLNPDVPRKESGIFWLNSIPKHWQTVRIKDVVKCLNRTRVPLSSSERGQMKNQIFDYYGASGVIDKVEDYLFDDELLLIAEDGTNLVLRNLPLAIIAKGKFWVNNHAHIFKPKHGNLEYLALLLESIDYRPWITGAAQPKLTQDRIMAVQLPYPPLIEQQRILTYIKSETHLFDETISRAQREIELIQEYRTRLVADVVTGRVDVRGLAVAAGGIEAEPELVDEEETDEESETLLLEEADAD